MKITTGILMFVRPTAAANERHDSGLAVSSGGAPRSLTYAPRLEDQTKFGCIYYRQMLETAKSAMKQVTRSDRARSACSRRLSLFNVEHLTQYSLTTKEYPNTNMRLTVGAGRQEPWVKKSSSVAGATPNPILRSILFTIVVNAQG